MNAWIWDAMRKKLAEWDKKKGKREREKTP